MTTFATYDLPTRDLYNRATESAMLGRAYDRWHSTGDDADMTALWLDCQSRAAAALLTADPADVRTLVELATVRPAVAAERPLQLDVRPSDGRQHRFDRGGPEIGDL